MQTERSTWGALSMLAVGSGAAVALCGYVAGGVTAAVWAVVGCSAGFVLAGVMISRWLRAAARSLHSDVRHTPVRTVGIFGGLVRDALEKVEQSERQSREAARQRTELEARLNVRQRSIRRLEAALNELGELLLITDSHDHLLFFNAAAGRFLRSFVPSSDPDADIDVSRVPQLATLLEETRSRNAATNQRTAELECDVEGETVVYRARATNVCEEDGTMLGVVTMLSDIRDERKEKARHAEFVSSVCHELKTPMAGIKAYTEMLVDGDVTEPEERQELYGFIETQVDRLTRLVNNMLNLARIESGVIKVAREDCSLNDVLEKAAAVVGQLADEKGQTLETALTELYVPVHVDKDLFGQAVINLLSNAVKYTPEGGRVQLRSRLEENHAVIEVRDNGMGIPESSLPQIFDRFYRVPENNRAAAGTGLGLSLVHYIVTELHNGSVAVASHVGEGTTFTLAIPVGHLDQNRKKQAPALAAASAE